MRRHRHRRRRTRRWDNNLLPIGPLSKRTIKRDSTTTEMVHQDAGDKETKDNNGTNDRSKWWHAHTTQQRMTNPSRHSSHHNKTRKQTMNNPQTQQLQTKTDINTTEMTPKTCTQNNKTPTTKIKPQRPMDPQHNSQPTSTTSPQIWLGKTQSDQSEGERTKNKKMKKTKLIDTN